MNHTSSTMRVRGVDLQVIGNDATKAELSRAIAHSHDLKGDDSAFYVCDLSSVVEQYALWQQCLSRVRPYYAVKCNSDPMMLRTLAKLGCGFDCASKAEMDSVLAIEGIDPRDDVIYANPCKTRNYIKHAAAKNVDLMTFDSVDELKKIKDVHPHARVVLRINIADTTAQCPLAIKFGAEPGAHAESLVQAAIDIGVRLVGVSFHVGSGCRDPNAYSRAIAYSRHLFDLGNRLGHDMTILDLGGGYPGADQEKFILMAEAIQLAIDTHFPENELDRTTIIAEPGRYFAAATCALNTTVMARSMTTKARIQKKEATEPSETGCMYYINDGVYGSFNCIIYDHSIVQADVLFPKDLNAPALTSCVWGPTCDGLDLVVPEVDLPLLDDGDWLHFNNMGAYTLAAGCEFNGFPRPKIYYVSRLKHASLFASMAESTSEWSSGVDSLSTCSSEAEN